MDNTVYNIEIKDLKGQPMDLSAYKGKKILLVNTASACGLTPHYAQLQELHENYADKVQVIGLPCNDFGAQEPGTKEEIAEFCRTNFSVDFPMYAKIAVTGADTHPLYSALIGSGVPVTGDADGWRTLLEGYGITPNPAPGILWNFEKFVIARDGTVAARFSPNTAPDDPALIAAIEAELAKA